MKYFLLISVFFISCTTSKKISEPVVKAKAKEKIEGAVVSKETPSSVSGFKFEKKYNAYFRNDLSTSLKSRVVKKLKKGQSPKDDKSKFSSQVKAISSKFKYPFWSDYFGDSKNVTGMIQLNILVSKYGKPEVIIIDHGIDEEVDRITVDHVKNFPFKPAIHKKSGNPTRAWIKIRQQF